MVASLTRPRCACPPSKSAADRTDAIAKVAAQGEVHVWCETSGLDQQIDGPVANATFGFGSRTPMFTMAE